ncbi:unnamed protein product [Diatraea saccharalis]|uniref:Elongation of very long chain fatty acids protein n=1 Tax=Diatraea saccharalis TaxID=40085 RepID=A0A9N9WBG7_9NEOP|nr:unnamed protein product [Diatraea saccharalis]
MSYLEKVDKYLDSLKVGKSAIVDSWFMMSSPKPIVCVVLAYMLVIKLVPILMKNRPPLQLNKLIAYYNAFQVFLASLICTKALRMNLFSDGILYAGCRYPSNTHNPMLLELGWWYFFAKFTELLDTVFFVLRKKNNQMQFCMMLLYCAWTHFSPRCQYASGFTYFISGNITIFLLLFLNFYSKSYKGKKNVEKEIKEEYKKLRNGVKTNDTNKPIVIATQNGKKEENGFHRNNVNNINELNDNTVLNGCRDYSKDAKVFLTRRPAKEALGPHYDYDSVIKK